MTWNRGESAAGERKKRVSFTGSKRKSKEPTQHSQCDETSTTGHSLVNRLKARSFAFRHSKKKKHLSKRRSSHAARRASRVVHFAGSDKIAAESETLEASERAHAFRRSSRCRQPVRRISRVKGSPPPALLARIQNFALAQPNFDQTSDGESEDESEDPLPPIQLPAEATCLDALAGETPLPSDEGADSSEEETFTVLPAITVTCVDEKRCEDATDSVARRASVWQGSTRRRSVRRMSMRRASVRRASVYRASMRRASIRRESVRRASVWRASTRRQSVAAGTVRRKSSQPIPGYTYRRQSVAAVRVPCHSYTALRGRKKCRKPVRQYRRPRKIVVIGDMCSGKTGLISAYCRDKFSETYVPTFLNSCMTDADVLGQKIELVVVEVPGRKDLARLRRCAYHKMDVVLLCYSADSPSSLKTLKEELLPELKEYAPKVPYILVGTKTDVREERICQLEFARDSTDGTVHTEDLRDMVTSRQGVEAAEGMGAQTFLECSALYRDGTREVFETAAKVAQRRTPRRKKKQHQRADTCVIL